MNFLGVGPAELIVILVVALIFVGPERLPRMAAELARTIREVRKYTGSIAAEFTDVLQEFEKDTAEDRSQWKDIGQGLTDATKSVSDALRDAHDAAAGTATTTVLPQPAVASPLPPALPPSDVTNEPAASAVEVPALDAVATSEKNAAAAAATKNGVQPTVPEPANEPS